jgi:hypothetical protein
MEIKLYKSFWKSLLLLVASVAFVAGGIIALRDPEASHFLAWCGICLFGAGIPFWLINLFDRRPQIVIHEDGILDRSGYTDYIPWHVVRRAYIVEVNLNKVLFLVVDKEYLPARKKKLFTRFSARMNKTQGGQELLINVLTVSVNVKKLMHFLVEMPDLTPEVRRERIAAWLSK